MEPALKSFYKLQVKKLEVSVIISNRAKSGIINKARHHNVPYAYLSSKNIDTKNYDTNLSRICQYTR